MKNSRHSVPQVNTGSMADIAFLLLIFFLVTTSISADKGINRRLPENCPPGTKCSSDIKERNVFRIAINANDELLVEDDIISINHLKSLAKAFLDNNGDATCDYCNGNNDPTSSDHPSEAVISLQNDHLTSYSMYIAVQDILTQAYYELREDYAKNVLGKTPNELTQENLKLLKKSLSVYPFGSGN